MKITANFSEAEFLPARVGSFLPNRSRHMVAVLAATLETIRMEARIRAAPLATITINSGVRPPEYNAKIGGAKSSDHLYGFSALSVGAADIVCPQMNMADFFNLCLELKYDGRIRAGQILLEKNKSYWVHIANDPALFLTPEQMAKRSAFSLYGCGWNFENGKAGHWHEIACGKFFEGFD